jgi:predicted DNA-binding antitoxin AbrB/MazE fold protein
MTVTLEAIYEQGILRLSQPIPLAEGTHVQVTINSPPVEFETKSSSQILKDIAAMPLQGKQDEFSGRDHDKILYSQHDVL